MVSMLDNLISEILLSNPDLLPQEVSHQITFLIEKEILPATISAIRLPSLPSPMQIKQEEYMRGRHGKKYEGYHDRRTEFIQDLEKLRVEFNGSNLTNEDIYFNFVDNTQLFFGKRVRSYNEQKWKTLVSEPAMTEKKVISPSSRIYERTTKKVLPLIDFDTSVSRKIVQDPTLERIIGGIETKIRQNFDHEPMVHFSFSVRTDMADPSREKTIISINLPDRSFDERMKFWDKIEDDVREVMYKLDLPEPERRAINRDLITHVEAT